MMKGKVVIRKCQVGYGIYEEPYFFEGIKHEGLLHTARTKEECEEWAKDNGLNYQIEI